MKHLRVELFSRRYFFVANLLNAIPKILEYSQIVLFEFLTLRCKHSLTLCASFASYFISRQPARRSELLRFSHSSLGRDAVSTRLIVAFLSSLLCTILSECKERAISSQQVRLNHPAGTIRERQKFYPIFILSQLRFAWFPFNIPESRFFFSRTYCTTVRQGRKYKCYRSVLLRLSSACSMES